MQRTSACSPLSRQLAAFTMKRPAHAQVEGCSFRGLGGVALRREASLVDSVFKLQSEGPDFKVVRSGAEVLQDFGLKAPPPRSEFQPQGSEMQ
eukprot:1895628-Rhodomonas_salina.1